MGHLINPITYRLGKTKFWSSVWSSKTRKNYKSLLVEDLNYFKFLNWVLSVLSWNKVGIFINDFSLVKNFDSVNISFFFYMNKLKLSSNIKAYFYKFLFKNKFLIFFFKILANKKFLSFKSFFSKKIDFFNLKKLSKHKRVKGLIQKRKRVLKFLNKLNYGLNVKKRRKNNKRKQLISTSLLKYFFFNYKDKKKYKKYYLKKYNFYFLNKNLKINSLLYFDTQRSLSNILQKNILFRSFNYKFFFRVLSLFLSFFLKKVFKHDNFFFNFFKKNSLLYNAKSIKQFIRFGMSKNRSRMTQVVKKVFKKTRKKYFVLGLKIGFFGRYEKKLRNKNVWQVRGSLSPSNINTPITHKNFCILLKQGLCGVKVSFLSKLEKNEIFKKKTFINKTFKIW